MFDAIGLDVVVNQLISSLDGIRVVVLMIDRLVIYKEVIDCIENLDLELLVLFWRVNGKLSVKFLMDVLYASISLFKNLLSIK